MYGSSLRLVTRTPREARIAAREAAAMPFPARRRRRRSRTRTWSWTTSSGNSQFYRKSPDSDANRRAMSRTNHASASAAREPRDACVSRPSSASTASIAGVLRRSSNQHTQRHHHLRRLSARACAHRVLDRRADAPRVPCERSEQLRASSAQRGAIAGRSRALRLERVRRRVRRRDRSSARRRAISANVETRSRNSIGHSAGGAARRGSRSQRVMRDTARAARPSSSSGKRFMCS